MKVLGFLWCALTVVIFLWAMDQDVMAALWGWLGLTAIVFFLWKAGETAVRR